MEAPFLYRAAPDAEPEREDVGEAALIGTEEAAAHLRSEIAKLEAARQQVYAPTGRGWIDPTALGEEDERLGNRIRQLKLQLAELTPVDPEPEEDL